MSPRLHVAFPESLVAQPVIYELVKEFDVVPNIRRAAVEADSGWMILELGGDPDAVERAIAYLGDRGCVVNPMEGDVVAG
ncbi:MAG: NIL domain-containing protein [Acidimicrobiia bacterium]